MLSYKDAFVHPFNTANANYLYDVNTGMILKVSNSIYNYFKNNSAEDTLVDKDRRDLDRMTADGYLKPNNISKIEHGYMKFLPELLDKKIQGITLQVTQDCNLRCKYCVYSGEYKSRTHKKSYMTIEMARKGIDYLIKHSTELEEITVGFYGGEPLLNFDLIKDVVAYTRSKGVGKRILFHISTNATLFNDEKLKFLEDNNFSVLISVDGPREIHDANRRFLSGGGTFDHIMRNLSKIKEEYPRLHRNIIFNAVIDTTLDPVCTNQFFISCEDFENMSVQSSLISSEYRTKADDVPERFIIDEEMEVFKIYLQKIGRLGKKHITRFADNKFNTMYGAMYEMRPRSAEIPTAIHPSGPCIPGARKLFMTVDGTFIPCEKVSEISDAMKIGSVDTGFDLKKVEALLNIGKLTEEECKNCWALRLCDVCALAADEVSDTNSLSRSKKLTACPGVLNYSEELLKNFCTLKEYGYSFSGQERTMLALGRNPS